MWGLASTAFDLPLLGEQNALRDSGGSGLVNGQEHVTRNTFLQRCGPWMHIHIGVLSSLVFYYELLLRFTQRLSTTGFVCCYC